MLSNRENFRAVSKYMNYEVSDHGRLRNAKTGRILKPINQHSGYQHVSLSKNGNVKIFQIHRLVACAFIPNPLDLPQVDHIDNDKANNHVTNLRFCNGSDNMRNRKKRAGLSSCYKGVCWDKINNKWRAQININGKRKNLGSFSDEKDAARIYNKHAEKHHNEFAVLNVISDTESEEESESETELDFEYEES